MKFFKPITDFLRQINTMFVDIQNRKDFKLDIDSELDDPNSLMNGFGITVDKTYTRLSAVVNVPEEFQQGGTEIDIMNKLKEITRPMSNYLFYTLEWTEYLLPPEYYYLDDPVQPGLSRSYLAIWNYTPQILNNEKFWWKLGITSFLLTAAFASAITAAIILL